MQLLTHIRPHIDDVCGLWLLTKYAPEAKDSSFAFVPSSQAVAWLAKNPEAIAVGVGRGKFDEHKGDMDDCATTLVFKEVEKYISDPLERRAVQRIVTWVLAGDTGKFTADPNSAFSLAAIFRGVYAGAGDDSEAVRRFGFTALDALVLAQKDILQLEDDWAEHVECDSRFGKTAAFVSSAEGAESYAYRFGFQLALTISRDGKYHNIRALADSGIDLSSVAEALKEKDPQAEWFFHHSKKMLICGGYLAPEAKTSSLSLQQMIELVS